MNITRDNHYVPIWYQKRFILPGESKYFYLDQEPHRASLSGGQEKTWYECRPKFPSQCFYQTDLYTTFFGVPNDEIERLLFGTIDDTGARGVRAVLDHDMWGLSRYFGSFFEYMDAQKLRTPKGLDWIRTRYPKLNQLELMREMQAVRFMHCPMWSEGVREIVLAEDSEVKFIVSDHPVTVYNPACPPDSNQSKYPNDPSIALKGSQTIFPLDLNHCLIITNLEYAKNSIGTNPLEPRTNPRHRGDNFIYFGDPIAKRKIGAAEVRAINYLLKSRAKRFLASGKKEWLNPPTVSWKEIGKILLPPENVYCHFGGETYVGFKDGSSQYRDAFGRSVGVLPLLIKEPATEGRGPVLYDIRERNMMFFDAVVNILGLNKGKTWIDVRKELSDEQVKHIHGVYASLWPVDTNLVEMLPKPDPSVFRAVYIGLVDPRTIAKSVIGFLPYVDEMIVVNPFPNAGCIQPEYNPVQSPSQYKQETLKNVHLFIQLAPFIELGIVNMIPNPFDFSFSLREEVMEMASQRLQGWRPDAQFREEMKPIIENNHKRDMSSMPDEFLKRALKKTSPELTETQIEHALEHIKKERFLDPTALLQLMVPGEKGRQLSQFFLSPNLEIGLFLAQVTSSFLYTDSQRRWIEIVDSVNGPSKNIDAGPKGPFVELLKNFSLFIEANTEIQLGIRDSGKLIGMRRLFHKIWKCSQAGIGAEDTTKVVNDLKDEMKQEFIKTQVEWGSIYGEYEQKAGIRQSPPLLNFEGNLDCAIFSGGLGYDTIHRLLLTYGGLNYSTSMPMALYFKTTNTKR